MILISFFRKKTSKIYFIILFSILLTFGILIISKNYYLKKANNNYKGSFGIINNYENINFKKNKNIKRLHNAFVLNEIIFIESYNIELKDNEIIISEYYKKEYPKNSIFEYETFKFKVKEYYSESPTQKVIVVNKKTLQRISNGKLSKIIEFKDWTFYEKTLKDLKIDSNNSIIYLIKSSKTDYRILISIFSAFIYISFILFIIIGLIAIINILNDEKKNNLLYKVLGYSKRRIIYINILKLFCLLFVSIFLSSIICIFIKLLILWIY